MWSALNRFLHTRRCAKYRLSARALFGSLAMVQQNVGWSWQFWYFCKRRGSIIHRRHWTYSNARRLQSVLYLESQTYWPCWCGYWFLHFAYSFLEFLAWWETDQNKPSRRLMLGCWCLAPLFSWRGIWGPKRCPNDVGLRKGGKMAWRLFCSLFFKQVKFGPQIREPRVRFDSCGFWLIKY